MKTQYPDWVIKHKSKGTAIHRIRGRFYLYKIKSVWDPIKGRARKIIEKYLGRITPEGLIPSEKEKNKPSTVKETGSSQSLIS